LTLFKPGVAPFSVSTDDELCRVLLDAQVPIYSHRLWSIVSEATGKRWKKFDWGQLFVPIIFEGHLHGILVLGARTTGDVYGEQDIQIIATVAHQGALASANVRLVETLRGLTQRLVRDDEVQRKKVARDLHDAVLQDLFFIKQRLLRDPDRSELVGYLDGAIEQLRHTIKNQRTAFLDQDLPLALQDLVTDVQKLAGESTTLHWESDLNGQLCLTDEKATSIYRIAQEALYNALKHARAERICVKLQHGNDNMLRLAVEDNGIGLPKSDQLQTGDLRYGLIGMEERALMIGARLHILSHPGRGTRVTLEFTP